METFNMARVYFTDFFVPTRWGHQLNGNWDDPNGVPHRAEVPTRWGHQLNGNQSEDKERILLSRSPHSLGTPIEWKHHIPADGRPYRGWWSPLAGDTN